MKFVKLGNVAKNWEIMAMIKVGQIYRHNSIVVCITRLKANGRGYCINTMGTMKYCYRSDFEKYALIAEYPTWQEAVNSEYFKK